MALDILPDDFHKEMEQKKREKENTIGCRIKVDDGLVKVTIPMKVKVPLSNPVLTEDDQKIEEQEIVLTFSKREVKEFLQDIYVS